MSSLRLMQLITERLVKTFQDIHEAITYEVNKISTPEEPIQAQIQNLPEEVEIKRIQSGGEKQKSLEQKNQKKLEGSPQKSQKKTRRNLNSQKPKKPLSSFKLFLNEMKGSSQNKDDIESQNVVTKMATKKWQSMSIEQKKPYQQMEVRQASQYEKNLQQYYHGNPQERRKDLEKNQIKQQKKKQKIIEKKGQKIKERERNKYRQQQRSQKMEDNGDGNVSSEQVIKNQKREKMESVNEIFKKPVKQEPYKIEIQRQQSQLEQFEELIKIPKREQSERNRVQEKPIEIGREMKQSQDQPSRREIDHFLNLDQPSDSLGEDF